MMYQMRLLQVNLKMFFPGMSSKTLNKAISITNKSDFKGNLRSKKKLSSNERA